MGIGTSFQTPAADVAVGDWVERLARLGYAAKGVVYLLIGVLAAQAAFGAGGRTTGSEGVLRHILEQPHGRALLGAVALGLFGYALWRAITAVRDPEHAGGADAKRIVARVAYGISALVHAGLAWQAARLALGNGGGGSEGEGTRGVTAEVLSWPLGEWLVGAAGVAIVGYGLWQIRRGLAGDLRKRLRLGGVEPNAARLLVRLGRAGVTARGIVFCFLGWLVIRAALEHSPDRAGGVGAALRSFAETTGAPLVFGLVALGLAAYGVFELAKARYRIVSAA